MTKILNHLFLGINYDANKKHVLSKNKIKAIVVGGRGITPAFPTDFSYLLLPIADLRTSLIIPFLPKAF